MDKDRIRQLAQAHLDGRLSDEEFDALQRALESDAGSRAESAKLARLDSGLRDHSGDVTRMGRGEILPFPSQWPLGVRIAAAAAAIVALLFPLWWSFQGGDERDAMVQNPTAARGVAVISAEAGAVWENTGAGPLAEGVALEPGRLTLREGLAQIDFFGGASVSLSGPVEIELVSADEAVLHRGRIRADVPPAARGFEIRTADVRLEDLGTSFGVAAEENGEATVVVFDGEVRAIGRDGEAVPLYGGDAARLAGGTTSRDTTEGWGAFPDLASVVERAGGRDLSRYAHWKQGAVERRRDNRLIAYYDFEGLTLTSRRLKNRAVSGPGEELDGGIVGARVAQGRWKEKMALDFRREGDRVRFKIPGEFDAVTLYAWVRIDALDRHLNSLFLTDHYDPGEIHWQLSHRGVLHFATSPKGIEDLHKHNRRFVSREFWNAGLSGQWFLLATTADRSAVEPVVHYVNGEEIGFSGGLNRDKPLPAMRIGMADLGNWTQPINPLNGIRSLNGRIDEFAIFAAALSAEEIRAIYQEGKP